METGVASEQSRPIRTMLRTGGERVAVKKTVTIKERPVTVWTDQAVSPTKPP